MKKKVTAEKTYDRLMKKGEAARSLSTHKKPVEMKAIVNGCEEASPASRYHYIPCNVPAERNIYHPREKRTYRMCAACARHNVKNRGAIDKGPFHPPETKGKKGAMTTTSVKSLIAPRPKAADKSNEKSAKKVKAPIGRPKADDTSDFEEEGATKGQLSEISNEAKKAVALDRQIEDLEMAAKALKEERDTILNKTLPSLLDSAGMSAFDLEDGSSVEIKDVVSGTLPNAEKKPDERRWALKWLMSNGGRGLIKTEFKTEFGVGQERMAAFFKQLIVKNKFTAKETTGVHPQTLCAFVREKLENGEEVPVEKLGVYTGRHAKIKLSEKAQEAAEAERVNPKTRRG